MQWGTVLVVGRGGLGVVGLVVLFVVVVVWPGIAVSVTLVVTLGSWVPGLDLTDVWTDFEKLYIMTYLPTYT